MRNRSTRVFLALSLLICGGLGARAAMPVFWTTSSTASLLKGDVKNLSIDNHGRLMLGPAVDLVYESTAPFLWSLVTDPDGSIYVGSGNEGKVFKIDSAGKGTVFFDANELEVHALAISPKGDLYVGTSPDGRVYKIDRSGAPTPFFDPDDKYIWALTFDPQGNLYVGTGEKGIVYRVTPDGRDSVYYKTMTTHAVALAVESAGDVLVGTESPGKLFRIDRNGRGFVLVDSSFQEMHAIRLDANGTIYVGALSGRRTPEARPIDTPRIDTTRAPSAAPVPTVTTEVTSITIVDAAGGGQTTTPPAREERRTTRGAVYRVSRDGLWDIIWESRDDSPYDLSFEMDGSLLIGTGRGGKIYRLIGDPLAATLVAQADADQVTAFLRDAKGSNYYATANPGKLFRLSTSRAERGTYESDVRDAQTVAAWGMLSWRATMDQGGQVELFTRSGNTPSPDDTWSAWAGPYRNPDGEEIASPKARYLQWKAELSGRQGNPVLTSVTAAYLPKNARPSVTSITVHPPGTVFQKPFSTGDTEIAGFQDEPPDRKQITAAQPGGGQGGGGGGAALGRRVYQKGLQTFVWRAQDDNNDDLTFDVYYRREGETAWKPLKKDLTDPVLVWDTTSVPNGTYFVKVAASDAPSNAPGAVLVGELESNAFDIDNTPPVIRVTGVRVGPRPTLLFEVRDDQSALQRVEYSVDAERWKPVYPKDGIADSRFEEFELPLEGQAAVTGVIIRATDVMNNVATSHGVPTLQRPR